jgi:hypothetical protein
VKSWRNLGRSLNNTILILDIFCIISILCSIYFEIFLPYSYVIAVIILSVLLAFSIVKNGISSKIVFFQLFSLFIIIRNIYYLSTQNAIPFGDGYWDYAVEKIFLGQHQIDIIQGIVRPTEAGSISQLTWYSGWPLLHVTGILFSMVTGIDILYLNWVLPNFLSIVSFIFMYLILEKLRIKFDFPKEIILIGLLIFAILPEAIFWQMQFVRQSLAFTLLLIIIYLLYILRFEKCDRRYFLILALFFLSLAITHHVTALTLTLFLFLFSLINITTKILGRWEVLKWVSSPIRRDIFSKLSLLMLISMLFWWSKNSIIMFPTIISRITFFFESLGVEKIYSQVITGYPSIITPTWVPVLLGFRDLMIYAPAIIGFLILWHNKSNSQEKYFIIYSFLAFGIILVINIVFRIEPLRIVLFLAPFLTFLSSLFYDRIINSLSKFVGKIIVFLFLVLLVFTSFLGLWAHSFAPIHLYDSSISPFEIGESTPDFIKTKSFFETNINVTEYQVVRADVISQLVYLLDPIDYDKIQGLSLETLDELSMKNTLVCSFNDLNLYQYFGYIWSPIKYSEMNTTQQELENYVNYNLSRIYDDGADLIWVSLNRTYPGS